jgi:hypothetical protein
MGMLRAQHAFEFKASEIANAATAEAQYHRERMLFWSDAYGKAITTVQATAQVEFKEYEVTGGTRMDAVVNYGDPAAWKRAQEAWAKMHEHRLAAERLRTDAALYGSQGERVYELNSDDVHYFRLAGETRVE